MNLTVIDASGNKTEQVSLPEHAAAALIVRRLVEVMKMPALDAGGGPIAYRFEHVPSGRHVQDQQTLAQAGVKENDVLRLVATRDAGPVAAADLSSAPSALPIPESQSAPAAQELQTAIHTPLPSGPAPPLHPYGGTETPGGQQPHSVPPRSRPMRLDPVLLTASVVVVLLGVGVGALIATGVLSGGAHKAKRAEAQVNVIGTTSQSASAPATPSAPEQESDDAAIMSLLGAYQAAYSAHDTETLANLFSADVTRRGLAAGGCVVSRGRSAVMSDYESQFNAGSGEYRLVGLSESQIGFESTTAAYLDAHYQITPGKSGYVNFKFAETGEGWKISEVYATCK